MDCQALQQANLAALLEYELTLLLLAIAMARSPTKKDNYNQCLPMPHCGDLTIADSW